MSIVAVFIPGIMGSELKRPDGEIVWPPRVSETVFGYRRVDKLQDPSLRPTRVIANVSCVEIYSPIQSLFSQLGFGQIGPRRLIEHPYDWRRDLFDLAAGLASLLDQIDADEIVIVAHSMGGLIARLVLETPEWRDRSWFPKINSFIALATPHNGAPLALARAMGLDAAMGISAEDLKLLAENPAFPSGYQLLPAPGEAACWDTRRDSQLGPVDFYEDSAAQRLGLKPALVARARALHEAFRAGQPPEHVRYFYFSGAGHKTVTRVNIGPTGAQKVETPDAGDGTVPMWSALPRAVQKQVVINEHSGVFRGDPFKRVFARLLGVDVGPPAEVAPESVFQISVSLKKPVIIQGEPVDLVLSAESPIEVLEGQLVFEDRSEVDEAGEAEAVIPLSYSGPGVTALALTIDVALSPGFYELRFEGNRQQIERIVFAVSHGD